MDHNAAQGLASALLGFEFNQNQRFDLLESREGDLQGFHQWADGKPCLGSILVRDNQTQAKLWLLVIEWNPNHGYYLVIYPEDRSGPMIEIQRESSPGSLAWSYSPTKQDGRNEKRKELFSAVYGGLEAKIDLPPSAEHVPDFLGDVFHLALCHKESHFDSRETDFVVIAENDESQWDDETGVLYHFPKRYLRFLQPGVRAIYYKGKLRKKQFSEARLSDDPHYFGVATLGRAYPDQESGKGDYFVTITDFKPFLEAVPIKYRDEYLETIPASRESNYWRDGVRPISEADYESILSYASPGEALPNKPEQPERETNDVDNSLDSMSEGGKTRRFTTVYERNPQLRKQALQIHGYDCIACGFNFSEFYGEYADGFIHIHHVVPISEYDGKREVDPEHDLVPVCANCHSVIHRRKDATLTIGQLRHMIAANRSTD